MPENALLPALRAWALFATLLLVPLAALAASGGRERHASDWLGYRAAPSQPSARDANAVPPHLPFYIARRGNTTLYVLGTLHAGYASDFPARQPFRPAIANALRSASLLAFELSPDALVEAPAQVQRFGQCDYACLPQLVPAPLWRRLTARLGFEPATVKQVGRMRPWLAAMMLEAYDAMSTGMQVEYASEAQLQNVYYQNKTAKGRIVGLETLREQMQAFSDLTLAEQREMLTQDLAQTPLQNAADLRRVHALWRSGDAEALARWQQAKSAHLAHDLALSQAIDERVVYQRNRRFVERMRALAAPRKPLFVAIGALHLGGDRGVLALLRQAGYTVKPL